MYEIMYIFHSYLNGILMLWVLWYFLALQPTADIYLFKYISDKPDIVVGTPTRVLAHITADNLCVKDSLKLLIIDEADLMFAFDHLSDIQGVLGWGILVTLIWLASCILYYVVNPPWLLLMIQYPIAYTLATVFYLCDLTMHIIVSREMTY